MPRQADSPADHPAHFADRIPGDDGGERVADFGRDPVERAPLLTELVNALAVAPSGVSFVASCLDRLMEHFDLREARAVINDQALGLQLFNAGRRPFDLDNVPTGVLARGAGIHTEPALPEEVADLDVIAHLCEIALRLDRLHYESLHDPLTGLYNRRGFDDHLSSSISRGVRYGWAFGLVLIDLDGFKSINDRIGHQGGDMVLRQVGERIRQGLRAGDMAARVGGDEFALLLHIDARAAVDVVLDRLRQPIDIGDGTVVEFTAGLAMCPEEASTVDDLYRVADQRLYAAKDADGASPSTQTAGPAK